MSNSNIDQVTEAALEAFWAVVAARYPSATSGDLPIGVTVNLEGMARAAIERWVRANVPADAKSTHGPESRVVAPNAPEWLIEVADALFAAWFPTPDWQPDLERALTCLQSFHPSAFDCHHSGGGYLHVLGMFERDGQRYFIFTYPDGVEAHTTTAGSIMEAWEAATDEQRNAASKLIDIT